jgi:hypothetical protein
LPVEVGHGRGRRFRRITSITKPGRQRETEQRRGASMLYTIAVVLIILWLLGLVSSYTLGGFIHVLLVIAVVMILVNLISGRRAV